MVAQRWQVTVGDGAVSAMSEPADGERIATLLLAHGAGGHMEDRGMQALARELRRRGLEVVRFNFAYREAGSRRPDPMPKLQACVAAVAAHVRETLAPATLLMGGRSMGGRACSMMAADGFPCDGLLLYAYPLHPAGKPDTLRDAHLPAIPCPTLCVNGTRDTLCTREIMERVQQRLDDRFTMHWLDGADHSFHVLKSSGRTDADVLAEAGDVTARWLARDVTSAA